jgi:hypothetical protein
MRLTRWQWPSRGRSEPDSEAYPKVAKALGMPEPVVRRGFHEMLMKLRGVFDSRLEEVNDADLRGPATDVHPDFALLGDLLAGVLSPADELLLETRLRNDADAFERVWPLVEAWESNWEYPPAERIAGLVGGRLVGRHASVGRPQRRQWDDTPALDRLWTEFVARVGAVSDAKPLEEPRLMTAMRRDWRAAIAQHREG